jgi:hypothetical protein
LESRTSELLAGARSLGFKIGAMQQTYSFVGTTIRGYRYLFFALYEDYLDFRRDFVREFNVHIERFGRDLQGFGAVVVPFEGDIEATRSQVFSKSWSDDERSELEHVPSLLVIDRDFDSFSPRTDPWVLLHFGEARFGDAEGLADLDRIFRSLAIVANAAESEMGDIFKIAKDLATDQPNVAKVFGARPSIFGFSFDLLGAGREIAEWLESRRRSIGKPQSG